MAKSSMAKPGRRSGGGSAPPRGRRRGRKGRTGLGRERSSARLGSVWGARGACCWSPTPPCTEGATWATASSTSRASSGSKRRVGLRERARPPPPPRPPLSPLSPLPGRWSGCCSSPTPCTTETPTPARPGRSLKAWVRPARLRRPRRLCPGLRGRYRARGAGCGHRAARDSRGAHGLGWAAAVRAARAVSSRSRLRTSAWKMF